MARLDVSVAEVYTAREIARAGNLPVREVDALVANGRLRTIDGVFTSHDEALRVLRAIRAGSPLPVVLAKASLFGAPTPQLLRDRHLPLAVSTAVHGGILAAAVLWPLFGGATSTDAVTAERLSPARLVFLATPGPGGGGGGGGLETPTPPAKAHRRGERRVASPVPPPPPPPEPTPQVEPNPPSVEPPVEAPVAASPADDRTSAGIVDASPTPPSQGSGSSEGAGTGEGKGRGEGNGSGIGEGSGGGTGGGPYRPGSGVEPPGLLHEVKPDYSEAARRQSVEGDVVLEIVVRRDGSVGDVKVLQGLGHGLDERAVQAVRQWRFSPARRLGTPVDVMVEVAVEFELR